MATGEKQGVWGQTGDLIFTVAVHPGCCRWQFTWAIIFENNLAARDSHFGKYLKKPHVGFCIHSLLFSALCCVCPLIDYLFKSLSCFNWFIERFSADAIEKIKKVLQQIFITVPKYLKYHQHGNSILKHWWIRQLTTTTYSEICSLK